MRSRLGLKFHREDAGNACCPDGKGSDRRHRLRANQSLQMVEQEFGDLTTRNQHTSLHVLFHGLSGEIRTGDETHPAVCDGHFGVDATIGKWVGLDAGIEFGGRDQRTHLADRIE